MAQTLPHVRKILFDISISPFEYLLTLPMGQWHSVSLYSPLFQCMLTKKLSFFRFFTYFEIDIYSLHFFRYLVENVCRYLNIYSSIPEAEQYESHSSLQRFS